MVFNPIEKAKKDPIGTITLLLILILISSLCLLCIADYVPTEQYSTEVNRCSAEELDLDMSMNDTQFIQPYNPSVISTNMRVFGNESFENLTQEQWLRNADILFNWSRENIEYNASDRNPRFPNETMITESGDCKNMAFLYTSLAINAGVPAENIRVVIARQRLGESNFSCKYKHAYVELRYEYEGKTIWMPVELTNKKFEFRYFLNRRVYMPEVRFGWISYGKYGHFDDKNIEKDWIYEVKFKLYRL